MTASTNASSIERSLTTYFRDPVNLSLAFPQPLAIPTVSAAVPGPNLRIRVVLPVRVDRDKASPYYT